MSLNIKLLRNIVLWAMGEQELIDKKYEKLRKYSWFQDQWAVKERNGACQTAFCMAGAAVVLTGYKLKWDTWDNTTSMLNPDYEVYIDQKTAHECYPKGHPNKTEDIEYVAMTELGISSIEADMLFSGGNEISDVIVYADRIAYDHGKTLFKDKHLRKMSPERRNLVTRALGEDAA